MKAKRQPHRTNLSSALQPFPVVSCRLIAMALLLAGLNPARGTGQPWIQTEAIFSPEPWHNHASCLVETRRGDLLACWFHGSGERKSDDVRIEGARLQKGARQWTPRFLLTDTPDYPDCNPCFLIDQHNTLWLFHTTILAHTWESALLKYHCADHWERNGSPVWIREGLVHLSPGTPFVEALSNAVPHIESGLTNAQWNEKTRGEVTADLLAMKVHSTNELYRRLGWMPRAHPMHLGHRILLPLYHDGFSVSMIGISDDGGARWHCSQPLIGGGNVQPSLTRRRDGTLVAWMRDNGPPPHRVMSSESRDQGETWSPVIDTHLPNPGSGVEALVLRNGDWLFIGNNSESGRHSLSVWRSRDEGRTWPFRTTLENDPAEKASFSYPSLIQSRDGTLHATYSVAVGNGTSFIRHAHWNEEWIQAHQVAEP
jgi:predicted neuraminidase